MSKRIPDDDIIPVLEAVPLKLDITVSDVIETVGLSRHHWHTIYVTWCIWIFVGWCATATVYLLDAAGERGSAWTELASPADRLTMEDKASVLLASGIVATVGNQILGTGSDLLGRMFMTECCVANAVVAVFGFLLARAKMVLMIFICINPFLKDGASFVTNAMLAEWLPVEWRGIFIVTLHAFWNVGRLLVTVVWAIIPPNEHWLLFFSAVAVIPVTLSIFLRLRGWRYESPRWLAVSGNMEASVANLKLAADSSTSGQDLPQGWDDPGVLKCSSSSGEAVDGGERTIWEQMSGLMGRDTRFVVGMLCVIFFGLFYSAIGFFYWAIEYFKQTGLQAAIVPAMIAAPIGKILANLSLIVGGRGTCIMDRCPRILIMQIGFFGFGLSIALLCTTRNIAVITANVFVGHWFQEIIWAGGCIYITEAFPTAVRNTASGVIFTVGQVGGILGSTLSGGMMQFWVYLPMVVMSASVIIGGLLCFALPPEKSEKPLTDTVSSTKDYGTCEA